MAKIQFCYYDGKAQVAVTILTPDIGVLNKINRSVLEKLPRCAQDYYATEVLHGGNTRFSIDIANPKSKTEISCLAIALHTGLSAFVPDLFIDGTLEAHEEAPA